MYRAFYREIKSKHQQSLHIKFQAVCTEQCIVSLSQNQQTHKIINKYKMYSQPLHMFRHINCHPQGVFIKELQVLIAPKYTIFGFTVDVFTQLTVLKCIDA